MSVDLCGQEALAAYAGQSQHSLQGLLGCGAIWEAQWLQLWCAGVECEGLVGHLAKNLQVVRQYNTTGHDKMCILPAECFGYINPNKTRCWIWEPRSFGQDYDSAT